MDNILFTATLVHHEYRALADMIETLTGTRKVICKKNIFFHDRKTEKRTYVMNIAYIDNGEYDITVRAL